MFGLKERDINTIHAILDKYPRVNTVYLFGSRAKATHKQGSDIDLAIMNSQIPLEVVCRLQSDFEDSNLPYFIDILDYSTLENQALKAHIKRVGKKIYSK
ncbi:DNA polymerase beta domain protein region [Candidatus Symbiothrix dinenymphae]|nr:DNA polymerase beta domain protein region [Candidatus Symbiothrix dinenymphae]